MLRKKLLTLLLIAFMTWPISELQATQTVTLTGRVVNGSRNNQPVAGQEVILYTVINGKEAQSPRPKTVTDSAGRFVFRNLESGDQISYYPLAYFQNVEYTGPLRKSSAGDSRLESDVVIFEPTTSDSAVRAEMHHVIVEPGAGGLLKVTELYVFSNDNNYTYAGKFPVPGSPEKFVVLQLELPDKVSDLKFGGDLMSCCAVINGNEVIDTMPFKPGRRQVYLSYVVPYKGSRATLTWQLHHPVATYDLFLRDPVSLASRELRRAGEDQPTSVEIRTEPVQFKGKSYQHVMARALPKDASLALSFAGLPGAPADYRWIAPLALVLLIAVVMITRRKRTYAPPQPASDLQADLDRRRELIEQILQLDQSFELGEVERDQYLREREALTQSVLEIDTRLKGQTSGSNRPESPPVAREQKAAD